MALMCGGYQGADDCTRGPQSGAQALMSWFLGAYPDGVNSGIYNCRAIPGSNVMSLHGQGRADDLGVRPYRAEWGDVLAEALRRHSEELGIQLIIWNRRIWSASYCDQGWRDYHGSNPHEDHLHVELSWHAALYLTADKIQSVLNPEPEPEPEPEHHHHHPGTRMLRRTGPMMRGEDVKYVQKWIGPKRAGTADGIFGPHTEAGVRWYQKLRSIGVDGIVGPVTWRNMRVRWKG